MSSEYVIELEGVGKCYHIYDKPSDRLKQLLVGHRRRFYHEFWALKGVDLRVRRGQTLGVIGKNGSGKSTLLQLICGTLNPTEGQVRVQGRVAALLELGAGFNPEFTGVENVYMAASLYGLTRDEVASRFDAIAAFADIGDHIEQPVKNYSSGMYVRLAFAVIANVDADVLIIDEALAVGDAFFVQKCMRFLREFTKTGTLLFVSHDTSAVLALCDSAVLLNAGIMERTGRPKDVTEYYLALQHADGEKDKSAPEKEYSLDIEVSSGGGLAANNDFGNGSARITSCRLLGLDGEVQSIVRGGESVLLRVEALAIVNVESPIIGFLVKNRLGQGLFGTHSYDFWCGTEAALNAGERLRVDFRFRMPRLLNGDYTITISIASGTPSVHSQLDWIHDAIHFKVSQERPRYGIFEIDYDSIDARRIESVGGGNSSTGSAPLPIQ